MDTTITFPENTENTKEETPLLLADMERLNPSAFDFSDIELPSPSSDEMDRGMMTLETAIGDYNELKRNFYIKAPTLRQQLALARAQKQLPSIADEEGVLTLMLGLGQKLIFKADGDTFRAASEDELLDNFSLQEIMDAMKKYAGMSTEGNA